MQRGNGKDVINVPFDLEIKSRTEFSPLAWLRQVKARTEQTGEFASVVVRMNGQGESAVPRGPRFRWRGQGRHRNANAAIDQPVIDREF